MTDREALAAALDAYDHRQGWATADSWIGAVSVLAPAARERLAQLPEKCEHGESKPHRQSFVYLDDADRETAHFTEPSWCPGKVYPAELVEPGMAALVRIGVDANDATLYRYVVAVLDALNGTPT